MELRVKVNSYFNKKLLVYPVIRNERGACPSDFLTDYTVKSFCLIISFHKCLEFYSIFIKSKYFAYILRSEEQKKSIEPPQHRNSATFALE